MTDNELWEAAFQRAREVMADDWSVESTARAILLAKAEQAEEILMLLKNIDFYSIGLFSNGQIELVPLHIKQIKDKSARLRRIAKEHE